MIINSRKKNNYIKENKIVTIHNCITCIGKTTRKQTEKKKIEN